MKQILIVLLAISAITCDFSFGSCPAVKYELESFESEKYLGKWYEIARSKSIPFESGACIRAVYTPNEDGQSITVTNSQQINGVVSSAVGKATRVEGNPFKLQVSFSDSFIGKLFKGDYQVVNTDYENFSIVYSCSDLLFAKIEYYWVLSRTPELPQEKLEGFLNYLNDKFAFSKEKFTFANQNKELCGY